MTSARATSCTKGFAVHTPDDLKHKNTYYYAGDPIGPVLYSLIGDVTPKQMGVPEILPGLTSGSINVVIAPSLAAEQLQWASRLDNINNAVAGVGIGALVFSSNKIKSLPADAQNILITTGAIAGQALTTRIRNEDDAAFNRLKARMTATEPSAAERQAWTEALRGHARPPPRHGVQPASLRRRGQVRAVTAANIQAVNP